MPYSMTPHPIAIANYLAFGESEMMYIPDHAKRAAGMVLREMIYRETTTRKSVQTDDFDVYLSSAAGLHFIVGSVAGGKTTLLNVLGNHILREIKVRPAYRLDMGEPVNGSYPFHPGTLERLKTPQNALVLIDSLKDMLFWRQASAGTLTGGYSASIPQWLSYVDAVLRGCGQAWFVIFNTIGLSASTVEVFREMLNGSCQGGFTIDSVEEAHPGLRISGRSMFRNFAHRREVQFTAESASQKLTLKP